MPPGPRSLHLISSLSLSSGGPTQSVTRLCEAMNALDHPAEIATLGIQGEAVPAPGNTAVHSFPPGWPTRMRRSQELWKFLSSEGSRYQLIHVHGLWEWTGVYGRTWAGRLGIPLVISPRGMLEPWSLDQRRWMKRLALRTWEGRNLRACRLLHATSDAEGDQFRALGLTCEIRVIPNPVPVPPAVACPSGPRRRLLLLSRYHPKKGMDLLFQAWSRIQGRFPDWDLAVHGYDSKGYRESLDSDLAGLGIDRSRVHLGGPLAGEAKARAFCGSELFILPSQSENFGNVVAEALSHGLPVITTRGTPWEGLESRGCGWWVPAETAAIESALTLAMSLSPDQRLGMGRRGRSWVEEEFSPEAVARRMCLAYGSVLGAIEAS